MFHVKHLIVKSLKNISIFDMMISVVSMMSILKSEIFRRKFLKKSGVDYKKKYKEKRFFIYRKYFIFYESDQCYFN